LGSVSPGSTHLLGSSFHTWTVGCRVLPRHFVTQFSTPHPPSPYPRLLTEDISLLCPSFVQFLLRAFCPDYRDLLRFVSCACWTLFFPFFSLRVCRRPHPSAPGVFYLFMSRTPFSRIEVVLETVAVGPLFPFDSTPLAFLPAPLDAHLFFLMTQSGL